MLALPVAALVFGAAILLARLVVASSWERVATHGAEAAPYARYRSFRAALPEIAATPDSAVVIGVCFSEKGFIPEPFDERLAGSHGRKASTFTLATASMHTTTMRLLSETVAAEYRNAGTRPGVVLVELSPSMVADESAEPMAGVPAGYNRALQVMLIRDLRTWADTLWRNPSLGAEVLGNWLLGGHTRVFTSELLCMGGLNRASHCQAQAPAWWPWPSQDGWVRSQTEFYRDWARFASALRAKNGEQALSWSFATRGYIERIPDEMRREHEVHAARRATTFDDAYIADYNRYDRDAVRMFSVDGQAFQKYLDGLRELQSLGGRVIVYISPKANYITAGPEDARLLQDFFDAAALQLQALDIPLIQMNSLRYSLDEFQNTWALLSEDRGGPKFSRDLADMVAAVLDGAPLDPHVARLLPADRPSESDGVAQVPFWKSLAAAQP